MPGVKGARYTLKAMRTLAGACVADDAAKAGFVCACAAGWGGGACAEDVNECDSAPCSNGDSGAHSLQEFETGAVGISQL